MKPKEALHILLRDNPGQTPYQNVCFDYGSLFAFVLVPAHQQHVKNIYPGTMIFVVDKRTGKPGVKSLYDLSEIMLQPKRIKL